jgi:hypothetical protein
LDNTFLENDYPQLSCVSSVIAGSSVRLQPLSARRRAAF